MAEIPKIVLPHGGYRNLVAYKKSEIVYQGTALFCRRFLPPKGDRTVDQMTQTARSCKQNIAEGSAASGTSKETELKLTNVARATLDELLEIYSRLDGAANAAELAERLSEIKRQAEKSAWGIRRRRGWQ